MTIIIHISIKYFWDCAYHRGLMHKLYLWMVNYLVNALTCK